MTFAPSSSVASPYLSTCAHTVGAQPTTPRQTSTQATSTQATSTQATRTRLSGRKAPVRHRDALNAAAVLFAEQHGAATRHQLRQCGLGDRQIERRVHEGKLLIVARGVYAIATSPATWERRVFAAQLFTSRRASPAALSHRTAAAVYGMHGAEKTSNRDTVIELISEPTDRHPNPLATMHRCSNLLPGDIEIGPLGLPMTSPNRTLLDLCLERSRLEEVEFLITDAYLRDIIDLESFAQRVADSRRQAGIVTVRRAMIRVKRAERKRTRQVERMQATADRKIERALARAAKQGTVCAA